MSHSVRWNQGIPTMKAMVSIHMGGTIVPWIGWFWMIDVGRRDVFCTIPTCVRWKGWVLRERARSHGQEPTYPLSGYGSTWLPFQDWTHDDCVLDPSCRDEQAPDVEHLARNWRWIQLRDWCDAERPKETCWVAIQNWKTQGRSQKWSELRGPPKKARVDLTTVVAKQSKP